MLTCCDVDNSVASMEDMVMILGKVFARFARKSPVTVMLRGVLEHALPKWRIDELFRKHALRQREDELLFSSVVNVLALAVAGMRKSVNSAYESCADELTVSVHALYDKLKGSEPQVAQALVRESAKRLEPVLMAMNALSPPLLPGYHVKILDGKHLDGTEHRLKETRTLNSVPLPGNVLVVLDPQLSLAVDAFLCEDAYAQERSQLPEVLETAEAGDVWIADRNFCTTGFLFGLAKRKARFLIRQHGSTLSGKRLAGRKKRIGRCETGVVYEQEMEIDNPKTGELMSLRRITVALDKPTRDGDTEIHLLTNLPETEDAITLAALYLHRWQIENLFGELKQALDAEVNTLCYPKAALLAFCVGLLTYNVISVLKGALYACHGEGAQVQRLSTYYLAEEIDAVYEGMMIAVPQRTWTRTFGDLSPKEMAAILKELAANTRIGRFKKRQRGTRHPPPKRTGGLREKHVSTQRLLDQRTQKTTKC
jgi:IS4 transposase